MPLEIGPQADPRGAPVWLRSPHIGNRQELRAFQEAFTQFTSGVQVEPLPEGPVQMAWSISVIDKMVMWIAESSPARYLDTRPHNLDTRIVMSMAPGALNVVQSGGRDFHIEKGASIFYRPDQVQTIVVPSAAP